MRFHEDLVRTHDIKGPSDRSFCFTFAVVLGGLSGLSFWAGGKGSWFLGGAAMLFAGIGVIRPSLLAPFNRAWFRLSLLLHKITTPIVMGILFYGAFVPTGMVLRLMRKDVLRLKQAKGRKTYWIERIPPGPEPDTMVNQF